MSLLDRTVGSDAAPDHDGTDATSSSTGRAGRGRIRLVVRTTIAAAAVGGALAGGAATAVPVADVLWSAALAALVTAAASRAQRWPVVWLAGIACAAAVGSPWVAAAAGGLVLAAASAGRRARSRIQGAVVGALAVQALLRLPDLGPHGTSAVVVLIAVAPVLWSGYRLSPQPVRRATKRTGLAVGVVVLVFSSLLAGLALLARADVQEGVEQAQHGLDLVRDGDQAAGTQELERASGAFADAARLLDAPWAAPARALPVVGDHADALAASAVTGRDLTATAALLADAAPYQDLRASAGVVDLDATSAMQAPMAEAVQALAAADQQLDDVGSPWLLAPLAGPLGELRAEVDTALGEARTASAALEVAPALLGGEADRRYLVLFTSPAESRALGGFVGAYGLLEASGGEVDFTASGGVDELTGAPGAEQRVIEGPAADEITTRYGRFDPARYAQNLTVSPDMETDAHLARSLYRQATGTEVDGVLVVDPFGLAALLELTGPVDVEGIAAPVTAAEAPRLLLHDQYLGPDADRSERKDRLEDVADATFSALTERDLPGPTEVGRALAAVVEERRLLFFPFVAAEDAVFTDLGTTGRFAPDADGDHLSVRSTNAIGNKIDWFVHRSVAVDVLVDPDTDLVESTVTVTLRNDAPAGGLPDHVIGDAGDDPPHRPPGTAEQYLAFYTTLQPTATSVDGQVSGLESQDELGGQVHSLLVSIPPGGSTTVVVQLSGEVPDAADYQLDLIGQPLVNEDHVSVTVAATPGWNLTDVAGLRQDGEQAVYDDGLAGDLHAEVRFSS